MSVPDIIAVVAALGTLGSGLAALLEFLAAHRRKRAEQEPTAASSKYSQNPAWSPRGAWVSVSCGLFAVVFAVCLIAITAAANGARLGASDVTLFAAVGVAFVVGTATGIGHASKAWSSGDRLSALYACLGIVLALAAWVSAWIVIG